MELFLAVAAERTRYIRLDTGVVSLLYHNPLTVAHRIALLDHLTRGRVMSGCGPGQLAGRSPLRPPAEPDFGALGYRLWSRAGRIDRGLGSPYLT